MKETTAGINKQMKGRSRGPIRLQATVHTEYVREAARVAYYLLAMKSSYLSSRQLVYNTSLGPRVKHITLGAAQ